MFLDGEVRDAMRTIPPSTLSYRSWSRSLSSSYVPTTPMSINPAHILGRPRSWIACHRHIAPARSGRPRRPRRLPPHVTVGTRSRVVTGSAALLPASFPRYCIASARTSRPTTLVRWKDTASVSAHCQHTIEEAEADSRLIEICVSISTSRPSTSTESFTHTSSAGFIK